jgi:hypothetical protein
MGMELESFATKAAENMPILAAYFRGIWDGTPVGSGESPIFEVQWRVGGRLAAAGPPGRIGFNRTTDGSGLADRDGRYSLEMTGRCNRQKFPSFTCGVGQN